jgi:hypothetical protein
MSFQCPQCGGNKSLQVAKSIELPADARSDEISLQLLRCRECRYESLAIYEASSRGALASESIDHYGYRAERSVIRSISVLIDRCPNPKDAKCDCASHRELTVRDRFGRWIRPGFNEQSNPYPIRL